jgi:transcriptional regulator with XRE-family HTH domain
MQYNAITMQQHSAKLAQDLREYMRRHGQSQSYVADETGVNQGTVSRWLKKPPQRVTTAHRKLCSYAERVLSGTEGQEHEEAVGKALHECWSRSEAHATAISKIISAFVELCRRDREEDTSS